MDRLFALMGFFSLFWFRRVWVIQKLAIFYQKQQEGALCSIEIYCGESRILPEALYQVHQLYIPILSLTLKHGPPRHELVDVEQARYDYVAPLRSMFAFDRGCERAWRM